ncbi:MAG: FAD binding domain-containing protein [Beijerinckiaceae bacterium]
MAIHLRPRSLSEALSALAAALPADTMDGLTIVAGATDFYPAAATREAWLQPTPQNVLDISAIPDLRGISLTTDGWRIGALTTWSDIIGAPLPPAFDGLKQAARQVGGVQIQNRGSIAGNLCNASPAADGVPPLLALDAEVELASAAGTRRLPLAGFVLGNRRTALRPDEMVKAVIVPDASPLERSTFLKLGARSYLVISIASVAVNMVLDPAGRISVARIAVGACTAAPVRLVALEKFLMGRLPADAGVETGHLSVLTPIDDVRASAAYRRDAALTLVRRAIAGFAPSEEQAA